jgi:hypothetical protein
MNKVLKILIIPIVLIIVVYSSYFIYRYFAFDHIPDFTTYKEYMWIFKNSVRKDIDLDLGVSYVGKKDTYNHFQYKCVFDTSYGYLCHEGIAVWEFKDLSTVDLKKITFNENVNSDSIMFTSGETINKGSDQEITIKDGFSFKNGLNINFGKYSKIEKNIESVNYRGFYGTIGRISFDDNLDGQQIFFNNIHKINIPLVFLVYKWNSSFYVIIIELEHGDPNTFNENAINMLDLK